jgi:hypothetical protein
MRRQVLYLSAVVVVPLVLAGCGGGGGDDSSTSASLPTVPQITTPSQVDPDRGSTSTTPAAPGGGQSQGRGVGPPGIQRVQEALAPFRECLDQQGVSLSSLRGAGAGPQGQKNSPQNRDQVEKAFTCIPKLPPQLRGRAEELKRRFEQRNG